MNIMVYFLSQSFLYSNKKLKLSLSKAQALIDSVVLDVGMTFVFPVAPFTNMV